MYFSVWKLKAFDAETEVVIVSILEFKKYVNMNG